MTLTELASNLDTHSKGYHIAIKKGETQSKFYNSKTKFPKTQSFSNTLYPSDKQAHQNKPSNDPKSSAVGTDRTPQTGSIDNSSANMQSLFSNVDFKQGITLDKVLGGQFKKIDIFDTNIKEFEKQKSFDDEAIDERTNETSEIEEKEYQYESFEILETDDEEDTISDIHQTKTEKDETKTQQPKGIASIQENHEILSRIQNKYKSSKPKFLPKSKPRGLRSRSPLKEKVEEINTESEAKERSELNKRRERMSATRTESKSSSPKFGYGQYPLRFPSCVYEGTQYPTDITPTASSETATKELVKNSSSPGQFATQTQNSFRGASNPFQTTNENFRNTNEKFRTSFMKKTFYNKPMGQINPSLVGLPEKDQNYERERTGSRSNSLAVTVRQAENSAKWQAEKISGSALEQKFMRENKMMAQKIKQSEKEMMDKYAKMFKLDQKESK